MFAFLSIAAKLRAAQAALAGRDYHAVAAMAADLLDTLGMASLAAHVRSELAAIGTGDARDIAASALAIVADVLNAAFGFGKPITVSAALPPGTDPQTDLDNELAHKCGTAATQCDVADSPKAMAAGPDAPTAIDPAAIIQLIALLAPMFERLFLAIRDRRKPA